MISITYIGLPRYQRMTQDNHGRLINMLNEIAPVRIYNCLQPNFPSRHDLPCGGDVGSAGGLQVWDFFKAVQTVKEEIIIKLRTDVWFHETSYAIVVREVQKIINGDNDVCYLGANIKHNFDKQDLRYPAVNEKKVPDYVIIAKKSALRNIDEIRWRLHEHRNDVASGNKVFRIITDNLNRSVSVNCHIFLVRKEMRDPTDWKVGWAFITDFNNSEDAARYWQTQKVRVMNPDDTIALVYTGQPRFPDVTKQNHQILIDKIKEFVPVTVYHYTTDKLDQIGNKWRDLSGCTQVYQFMEAASQTKEPVIVKFRTDLWFTPESMEAVMYEIKDVLANVQEASFMGSNWADYLGHEHTRIDLVKCSVVQDFVVIARRENLRPKGDVLLDLELSGGNKLQCGTKVFKNILQPGTIGHNVYCQIWLCRHPYTQAPTHYQVGLDYICGYQKQWKMPNAIPWIKSQQHRYE